MESTIVLHNFTCLDHAYYEPGAGIRGRSFNVTAHVTGKVEGDEQVVIDFSTVKSRMKRYIDDPEVGFDHKLWVGRTSVLDGAGDGLKLRDSLLQEPGARVMNVESPGGSIFAAVPTCVIDAEDYIGKKLSDHLSSDGARIKVKISLDENVTPAFSRAPYAVFHYVHGLRNSSSFGCQNVAHGHTSYLQLVGFEERDKQEIERRLCNLAAHLDDTVFVFKENLHTGRLLGDTVSYTSRSRGTMHMSLYGHKTQVLDTETTVEHLAEYIAQLYRTSYLMPLAKHLFVSEGLSKGCIVDL